MEEATTAEDLFCIALFAVRHQFHITPQLMLKLIGVALDATPFSLTKPITRQSAKNERIICSMTTE